MIKIFKYIFSYFFAAYFILAGVGYNVINYCCQNCSDEGIETIANVSCEAVHHHEHTKIPENNNGDLSCNDVNHHPDTCHLLRLSIDTLSVQTAHNFSTYQIHVIDLFNNLNFNYTNNSSPELNHSNQLLSNQFFASGRDIITFHAVLII